MQPGSLPIWVTLGVAVLGIVGLVVAQLINAWREDRRLQREREREDVRWTRDAAERHAQREHDARMHWREQRMDAYVKLLTVMESRRHALWSLTKPLSWRRDDPLGVLYGSQSYSEIDAVLETVRIIGSDELVQAAERAAGSLGSTLSKLRHPSRGGLDEDTVIDQEDVMVPVFESFGERVRDLRIQVRRDLGVDRIITSPPFGPTS